jgi:hypothetical protein
LDKVKAIAGEIDAAGQAPLKLGEPEPPHRRSVDDHHSRNSRVKNGSDRMFKSLTVGSTAVALGLLIGGSAFAQTSPSPAPSTGAAGATKMSQAECTTLWGKIDSSKAGNVSQAQAQPYISDFKAVDTNNDGKLSQAEFQAACGKGLVHSSAATGSGSGTGSSTSGTGTGSGSGSMAPKK